MQRIAWSMARAGRTTLARRRSPFTMQTTKDARAQFTTPTIHALMEHIISFLVNPTGQVAKLVMLVRLLYLIKNLGY